MQVTDSIRSEFAPSGVLRAGINLGNPVIAQPGEGGGEPRGVGPALARELARRLGVPISFTTYDTAGKLADVVKQGVWDVAFLAIDPARATDIDFTDAYVLIEGTYMVRDDSPLRILADVDRKGVRVAVGLKTAYDLFLTRELKNAELVRSATSRTAIEQFLADKLEAVAGVRQPLMTAAAKTPGLRVMPESFTTIRQASGVPKGRAQSCKFLSSFIEEAKRSGFVADALKASGVEASVAPPATSEKCDP